jgi:DNA-binding beta-propeller fold protein YncE
MPIKRFLLLSLFISPMTACIPVEATPAITITPLPSPTLTTPTVFPTQIPEAADVIGGIAVDEQGNVYVADNGNQRIQKFDSSGNFLLKWGSQDS